MIGMMGRMGMLRTADGRVVAPEDVYDDPEINDIQDTGNGFLRMSDSGRWRFIGIPFFSTGDTK